MIAFAKFVLRNPNATAACGYLALLLYASIYPFVGWHIPQGPLFQFLLPQWAQHVPRGDLLTNILVYIPFGFILANLFAGGCSLPLAIVCATLAGFFTSFAIESLQQFLPGRVASLADLVANGAGSLIGACGSSATQASPLSARLRMLRRTWVRDGSLANLGLLVPGLWGASHVTPFIPSLDVSKVRKGLAPIYHTLMNLSQFDQGKTLSTFLAVTGIALLVRTLERPGRSLGWAFFGFVAGVFLLKILIVMRSLSLETLVGATAAGVMFVPLSAFRPRLCGVASLVFVVVTFIWLELTPDFTGSLSPFNWVPFRGHLDNTLIGLSSIIDIAWPAAATAYLVQYLSGLRYRWLTGCGCGSLFLLLVFVLEWNQQHLIGRSGDITAVIITAGTWIACYRWTADREPAAESERSL